MKKIQFNYVKKFNLESEKNIFKSKVTTLNETLLKNGNDNIVFNTDVLNTDNFLLYAKMSFILKKKLLKTLFKNLLKQLSDNADIDVLLSVKYGKKTISRLIDIFSGKGFFECKKDDIIDTISKKFNNGIIEKNTIITVNDDIKIPDFIKDGFISAKLITIDGDTSVAVPTNNYNDVLNFIK